MKFVVMDIGDAYDTQILKSMKCQKEESAEYELLHVVVILLPILVKQNNAIMGFSSQLRLILASKLSMHLFTGLCQENDNVKYSQFGKTSIT